MDDKEALMRVALDEAELALGEVWPNPAVGCLIIKDGKRIALARTRPGGRPHAEIVALGKAGSAARDATVYVTLEPCNHHGKTPPCVDALLEAGVKRVEVATVDPDPRTRGAGIERLRAGGVTVEVGVLSEQAERLNAGFFNRVIQGKPLFYKAEDPGRLRSDAHLVSVEGGFRIRIIQSQIAWALMLPGYEPPEGSDRILDLKSSDYSLDKVLQRLAAEGLTRVSYSPGDAIEAWVHEAQTKGKG